MTVEWWGSSAKYLKYLGLHKHKFILSSVGRRSAKGQPFDSDAATQLTYFMDEEDILSVDEDYVDPSTGQATQSFMSFPEAFFNSVPITRHFKRAVSWRAPCICTVSRVAVVGSTQMAGINKSDLGLGIEMVAQIHAG